MSFAARNGEQLRPNDLDRLSSPPCVEDFQRIGLSVMHDEDLTRDQAMRLVNVLADAFRAAGVSS